MRFSRAQLVDYLRSSERGEPDLVEMKSTPLCSIQSLLVAILHDYWLAKYVMHVIAEDWLRTPDDGTQQCLSTGTLTVHSICPWQWSRRTVRVVQNVYKVL